MLLTWNLGYNYFLKWSPRWWWKKFWTFPVCVYVSRAYANKFLEKTWRRMRQVARGLGMGVGKEKDWARKDKVTYLVNRSRSIDEKKIELVQKNFWIISIIVGMECRLRSWIKHGVWIGHEEGINLEISLEISLECVEYTANQKLEVCWLFVLSICIRRDKGPSNMEVWHKIILV